MSRAERGGARIGAAIVAGVLAVAGLLGLPAAAGATQVSAEGTDPSGDQTAGGAAADIVSFRADYDDAGRLQARIAVNGTLPASSSGYAFVFLGTSKADGTCDTESGPGAGPGRALGIGDSLGTTSSDPYWGPPDNPQAGRATRTSPDASTIALAAGPDPALAGGVYDCAYATTFIGGTADTAGPVALTAIPLVADPPPPTTTPTDAPPASTPPAARVTLSPAIPKAIYTGRWTGVNVTVTNAGGVTARNVRVRLTPPAKVAVSPSSRTVGTLAAGASRTVRFRVRAARGVRAGARLSLTGSGTGLTAVRATAKLPVRRPGPALTLTVPTPRPLAAGAAQTLKLRIRNSGTAAARNVRLRVRATGATVRPGSLRLTRLAAGRTRVVSLRVTRRGTAAPKLSLSLTGARVRPVRRTVRIAVPTTKAPATPAAGGLARHVYLRLITGTPGINQNSYVGYLFVDDKWVYRGSPETGLPACTAKTAGVDADGDPTDGCLPYTYDAKSGDLRIDGQPAKLSQGKTSLAVGEDTFLLRPMFPAGARFSVALKNIEVYGLWPNQTVFTSYLRIEQNGAFAIGGSAIGSLGNGDPSTWSSTVSPDSYGTYEILAGGTIQLTFADGKVSKRMLLINGTPDTENGTLDPQKEGILLNQTSYWSS